MHLPESKLYSVNRTLFAFVVSKFLLGDVLYLSWIVFSQTRSVLNGGSTSIFMYAYFIIFYAQSSMSGLLQRSFYFGYNACICYAFFLMLGTISFRASLLFVRQIYRNVKLE
ncbi:hypothetical protein GIB67_012847 [Kingdonia uniflora]|uniref:Transmembrane 9 superfamily member n=1 Tax=Kingdonia uniflora TaxID=39325 RepID=A0A7J7NG16_9MAGN|nr:hypothetical protein GIB67_012847 [Kingdonia uniflora]